MRMINFCISKRMLHPRVRLLLTCSVDSIALSSDRCKESEQLKPIHGNIN